MEHDVLATMLLVIYQ